MQSFNIEQSELAYSICDKCYHHCLIFPVLSLLLPVLHVVGKNIMHMYYSYLTVIISCESITTKGVNFKRKRR